MTYDEGVAQRVREILTDVAEVEEKRMFGGLAFMINGNMACGVIGTELMIRLDYEEAERALAEEHTRPMDFTGKPLRGMVYVSAEGIAGDEQLASWAEAGADHAASLPPKQPKVG